MPETSPESTHLGWRSSTADANSETDRLVLESPWHQAKTPGQEPYLEFITPKKAPAQATPDTQACYGVQDSGMASPPFLWGGQDDVDGPYPPAPAQAIPKVAADSKTATVFS
jgi:hypothetical protein